MSGCRTDSVARVSRELSPAFTPGEKSPAFARSARLFRVNRSAQGPPSRAPASATPASGNTSTHREATHSALGVRVSVQASFGRHEVAAQKAESSRVASTENRASPEKLTATPGQRPSSRQLGGKRNSVQSSLERHAAAVACSRSTRHRARAADGHTPPSISHASTPASSTGSGTTGAQAAIAKPRTSFTTRAVVSVVLAVPANPRCARLTR